MLRSQARSLAKCGQASQAASWIERYSVVVSEERRKSRDQQVGFVLRASGSSERIAIFEPDDILVPDVMRDRLPESYIDRIVMADECARANLYIHNIDTRSRKRATGGRGGWSARVVASINGNIRPGRQERGGWCLEPVDHMPAIYFEDRHEFKALAVNQPVTRPDAVDQNISCKIGRR